MQYEQHGLENNWKYIKEVNGIKVFHRKNGQLKDVKLETTFSCKLSTLVEAVTNVEYFSLWIYSLKSVKIIKEHSDGKKELYSIIKMPWPIENRDIVSISKVYQDPTTKEVFLSDISHWKGVPLNEKYIRIKDYYVKWKFTPIKYGVYGEYIIHADPEGDIPNSVINLLVDEGPVKSITALKKIISQTIFEKNTHSIID